MNTDYLKDWNLLEQQQRTEFMSHMYRCSGRTNGLYTGLWQNFCINEAGPVCRQMFFDRLNAIQHFVDLEGEKRKEAFLEKGKEIFIPTLHD